MKLYVVVVFVLLGLLFNGIKSQLVPPIHNKEYARVLARKLSSKHDLSFDFYDLKFCRPKEVRHQVENLGDYLFGDRIENSVYNFKALEKVECKRLHDKDIIHDVYKGSQPSICPKIMKEDVQKFIQKVREEYQVEMIVDGMPIANQQWIRYCGELPSKSIKEKYSQAEGFPLGCPGEDQKTFYLNNHWTFNLKYHIRPDGKRLIVGAYVIPSSIDWSQHQNACKPDKPLPDSVKKLKLDGKLLNKPIPWSYSVNWIESSTRYASRWDAYLYMSKADRGIHWFSIFNSLIIIAFLTGMIAVIMLRILARDIAFFNSDEETDEIGWKYVHGDVFRPPGPVGKLFLCAFVGSGVQLILMAVISMLCAAIGFVQPSHRGAILQIMAFFFVFMGAPGGYVASRLYRLFEGKYWKTLILVTALAMPGIVFAIFSTLNLCLQLTVHSSNAIPITQIILLWTIWNFISLPAVIVGGWSGYRADPLSHPSEISPIPRLIPPQSLWTSTIVSFILGGILPFGSVFVTIYFVLNSIWLHKFYYLFPAMFVVLLILIVTCAEITIVLIYFQLCSEDYRWWWKSIVIAGSASFYVFGYFVYYFFFKLHVVTWALAVVFFEYATIVCFAMFIMTGTVGFLSTLWFLRKIFSKLHVS